ncbi:hypothetical protein BH20ACT5_BH20ACT5_05800 [soil metagenome]
MTTAVSTERVRFASGDNILVGDLHRPLDAPGIGPAVVVTGSWTTVKEQMSGLYARLLAAEEYITLAFDFTGHGQSQGPVRDLEEPVRKSADIAAAIGFLTTLRGVDPDRLGALAICASAGYTAVNTAHDPRVASLALVAPWLHNPDLVKPYYGGEDGIAARIRAGDAARTRFEATGEVEYVPAVSTTDETAAMYGPWDYYLNPDRGAIPEWGGRFAVMAWPGWLTYDPIAVADQITQPVQIVHSHQGAVPEGTERFYERLSGPKDIVWTEGEQLDFYDQPTQVSTAIGTVHAHFQRTL